MPARWTSCSVWARRCDRGVGRAPSLVASPRRCAGGPAWQIRLACYLNATAATSGGFSSQNREPVGRRVGCREVRDGPRRAPRRRKDSTGDSFSRRSLTCSYLPGSGSFRCSSRAFLRSRHGPLRLPLAAPRGAPGSKSSVTEPNCAQLTWLGSAEWLRVRHGSPRLGAGRSQVQILSPRLNPPKQRSGCRLRPDPGSERLFDDRRTPGLHEDDHPVACAQHVGAARVLDGAVADHGANHRA